MSHFRTRGSAVITIVLTACASTAGIPPESVTPSPHSGETVTPQPSAAPAPVVVDLSPEHTLTVGAGGHIIRLAAVGEEVWATGDRSIVRIDAETHDMTTVETPVAADSADSFGVTAEAVWLGDFDLGKIYRLDPTTGAVLSELSVDAPVGFASADGMVWVASGTSGTMVAIDPSGSEATVTDMPSGLVAGDSVWSSDNPGRVDRIDLATSEVTSIDVPEPAGPGDCSVKGSYPDSLWLLCHENDTAARIDPGTNSVIATLEVGSPVFGGVHTAEHWAFFVEGTDEAQAHDGRIVRVDLNTNQIDRIFDLGPEFDPNVAFVTADAMWVPMEPSGEIWRLPMVDLLEE